ncbi:MAG: UvrD-helicase domain-containing protein [Myxococcota bacterium]
MRAAAPDLRSRDAATRRIAQTRFDRPLLVEAGAGTGKTRVLVSRIVAWCLGPGWEGAGVPERAAEPDEARAARVLSRVVAITFTEAAASEMASRVAEMLRALRDDRPPAGFEASALPDSARERRARAEALLATLDRLTVSTIHAWCRALLAEHALDAGLDPAFEVDANETRDAEVVREVVEAYLREALAGPPPAALVTLSALGIGPARLEQTLVDLVRAGTLPEMLEADPFATERLGAFHAGLRDALARLAETIAPLRGASGRRTQSTAGAVAGSDALLGSPPGSRAELEALVTTLREHWDPKDLERLRRWSRGGFGSGEGRALGNAGQLAASEAAERAHGLLAHALTLDPGLLTLLRGVLRPLLADVQRELRARGVETYAALLRDASELVAARAEVAARVRRGIDQLLVDEFQDTDTLQCRLLRQLAFAGEAAERPGLFVVGDPKQSIYGWRNADLRAFHGFRSEIKAAGGEVLPLLLNFRSPPEILEEVTRVVAPTMREAPGVQPAFEPLLAARASVAEGVAAPPVEHWISWGWKSGDAACELPARETAELEARAVASDLVRLHREHGVAWKDVALLFRSTGDFETYLGALRQAGVPSVVERDRSYHRRREIVDASALVRTLLDPNDHVALVTWLRSPWVGVPDAALLPLWRAGFPKLVRSLHGAADPLLPRLRECVEAALREVPAVPGLERIEGFEQSLLAALEALAIGRACFDEEPSDVFVEQLRALFALEPLEGARYLGAYRAANLDRFFRHLVVALERSGGNVGAVVSELRGAVCEAREEEEGRPKDAAEDAVQVMTIHRAKGLDFDHVYLLQHHKGRGRGSGERAAEMCAAGSGFGAEYWLADPRAATPGFGEVRRATLETERAELVRTLYVATTRARERLVLVGEWPLEKQPALPTAQSHAELLAHRSGSPEDLAGTMAELAGRDAWSFSEEGTLFAFPALRPQEPFNPWRAPKARPADGAALRRESRAILEARARARVREADPRLRAASQDAAHASVEIALGAGYGEDSGAPDAGAPPRELALAVGSAVHRALEELDPSGDPDRDRQRCLESVRRALSSLAGAGPEDALSAAAEVVDAFLRGPLYRRLLDVAPGVLARELPVLLPLDGPDTSVGAVVGTIDLLYRDPEDGCFVVADYKTDRLEGSAAHVERASRYAGQGAVYRRAIRESLALGQDPRFELWFLRSGRVECLATDGT